MLLLHDKDQP